MPCEACMQPHPSGHETIRLGSAEPTCSAELSAHYHRYDLRPGRGGTSVNPLSSTKSSPGG
jgi:hypothetical protein